MLLWVNDASTAPSAGDCCRKAVRLVLLLFATGRALGLLGVLHLADIPAQAIDGRFWHKADMPLVQRNFPFRRQSGHPNLTARCSLMTPSGHRSSLTDPRLTRYHALS